jgi:hypothetical protein
VYVGRSIEADLDQFDDVLIICPACVRSARRDVEHMLMFSSCGLGRAFGEFVVRVYVPSAPAIVVFGTTIPSFSVLHCCRPCFPGSQGQILVSPYSPFCLRTATEAARRPSCHTLICRKYDSNTAKPHW